MRVVFFAGLLAVSRAFAQAEAGDEKFTAANPPAMKPLAGRDTPAFRAAKLFRHGVNLGDYLEAGRWGVKVEAGEFAAMKHEGFDHVRVPIGWHRHAGTAPDFTLSPEIFSKVDFAVTNILANKMAVIINIHHFLVDGAIWKLRNDKNLTHVVDRPLAAA